MATVIHQSELLRRALTWLDNKRQEHPEITLPMLMDEAGMRFNLSPADADNLERLVKEHAAQKQKN